MAEERKAGREKSKEGSGSMTVSEAGRLGGERVRELVEEGKESERMEGKQSGSRSSGKGSSRSGEQSR